MTYGLKSIPRIALVIFALTCVVCGCSRLPTELAAPQTKSALPRAMSINACSDQLLFALADKAQIVSLSHYARDRFSSPIAEMVQTLPSNNASAEEVLASRPEILFQSPFEKPAISAVAKSLDIKTYWFGVPNNVDEAVKLIENAGVALGQTQRAQNLMLEINEAAKPSAAKPVRALIYFQGGYSAGENTLIDDIMMRSGLYNMARDFGVGNWGKIDIESLIGNPPELLIIADGLQDGSPSSKAMRHQALFRKELGIKFANFPNQYSYCGGPVIIDLANHLKRIRADYERK